MKSKYQTVLRFIKDRQTHWVSRLDNNLRRQNVLKEEICHVEKLTIEYNNEIARAELDICEEKEKELREILARLDAVIIDIEKLYLLERT
jgi:hypothetical protein